MIFLSLLRLSEAHWNGESPIEVISKVQLKSVCMKKKKEIALRF
jgi:hypothetical protein